MRTLGTRQILAFDANLTEIHNEMFPPSDVPVGVDIIHDIVSAHSPQGKYPWKPCSHLRLVAARAERPQYTEYDWLGNVTETWNYPGECQSLDIMMSAQNFPSDWTGDLNTSVGLLPDHVLANHARKAIRNVTQQMDTTVSIANFLYELKGGLKSLLPRLIKNPLALASGNWLWWNFGFLPLVNDIKKLLTLVADINKQLDHLKRVNGRQVTVRYKGHWTNNDLGGQVVSPCEKNSVNPGSALVEWEDAKIAINIRANYNLDLKGADVFIKAMASALGLLDPVSIVWQAIPYSFIVDWFVNADKWIEDNIDTLQPFTGTIQMCGADHTIRKRTMLAFPYKTNNNGSFELVDRVLIRAYHRRAACPNDDGTDDGLTPTQLSLLLALIAQGLGK